ncbi:O-methyltransferase [Reichenbachiella sp. MSK19-1]|uniref:O-methyltransferase n=1 Tax=Reichenbachiella sp. MSK19-1 TaxID=1897631 RepID=UPI000E6CB7AF|nr:O-methyltransferase [Reichenbachiella sp. MSK19-1]RJE75455.1 methyltransferase [Reichenbachiella sp. MSK19-1]
MDFLANEIQRYAEQHSQAASSLLEKIDRETHLYVMRPRMLSGHMQGRVLSMFSHMIRPKVVLEIGTYTGYSALCLAEGLAPDGRLITLDVNEELEERVRGYLSESSYDDQIDFHVGNALEIIPTIDEVFDLVFIDADKSNYQAYFDLVLPKMRQGGFIIADNVLWSGKVVDEKSTDKDTKALLAFNQNVHQDDRVENVLMPVRDGLMILRVL